jgi:ATP-dependent Clp protease adaptor protein ClpS|tara:strand:+ start:23264 stop:23536 length:273 start_codon:yes stop_codon:yes gene_type:complete
MSQIDTQINIDELISELNGKTLVLYNDDHNTFDYVIKCLMIWCDHSSIQAEQCAMIVHTKGKCSVKHGVYSKLEGIQYLLSEAGLTVSIE